MQAIQEKFPAWIKRLKRAGLNPVQYKSQVKYALALMPRLMQIGPFAAEQQPEAVPEAARSRLAPHPRSKGLQRQGSARPHTQGLPAARGSPAAAGHPPQAEGLNPAGAASITRDPAGQPAPTSQAVCSTLKVSESATSARIWTAVHT